MPFSNFEKSGQPKNTEQKKCGNEKTPQTSSWKERLKYYAKVAAIVGTTSLFTVDDIGDMDEQRYQSHLDEFLNKEKKEYLDSLYSKIRSEAGYEAVEQIKNGDKAAFSYDYPGKETPPNISGFEDLGVNSGMVEQLLSEDFFFPQNWIQGEIKEITYVDEVKKKQGGIGIGRYTNSDNAIVFFRKKAGKIPDEVREALPWFYKHNFAHESAHANDWETDKDLNIIERAELLTSVINRLNSENSYKSPNSYQKDEYYEIYLDGTKTGNRHAAQEYWAEICKTYFSRPEYLKQHHPEDFELVDEYVKKQDPDFDPFASGGPYFDGQTGEMLPKWKGYIEKQLPDK
jgi:hypothetical protein